MDIGSALRRIREKKGLTLHQVSAKSGLGVTTINDTENNKSSPRLVTLFWIAGALGVKTSKIIQEAERDEQD